MSIIYIKKVFSIVVAVALFVVFTGQANAQTFQVGIVQGLVSGSDNNPLVGADIQVDCNSVIKNTTSNASGFYSVQYANEGCDDGDTATVTATKDGQTGIADGVLQDEGTIGFLNLDVAVIHVPVVPEFGLITGGIALLTSAGSYYVFKRRAA